MKAEIKSHIIIDDFFISPELYVPDNKNVFDVGLSFDIGPKGADATEIFHVNISNKCYKKQVVFIDENIIFRKGCIELEYYDYSKIMKAINKYIHNINCNTWDEIETELIKVFFGEYENYNR
jgi:hypothetical protein